MNHYDADSFIQIDNRRTAASTAIKQLQEAVDGYKDLDVALEIEKVDHIDESLQEKILTRLACKEAQKFKAAFTRFERTATLPTQIHNNMGLNVSLNTDKFYASLVSEVNDEALATITTARMMQAQSLVAEAALSEPKPDRSRKQMLEIATAGVLKIGATLTPKFSALLSGTLGQAAKTSKHPTPLLKVKQEE